MSRTIDADLVRHIGKLSRIELTDEQVETFRHQLADILAYFGKLQELDTEGVEPMAHAVELHNVLADDEPGERFWVDKAAAIARQTTEKLFTEFAHDLENRLCEVIEAKLEDLSAAYLEDFGTGADGAEAELETDGTTDEPAAPEKSASEGAPRPMARALEQLKALSASLD